MKETHDTKWFSFISHKHTKYKQLNTAGVNRYTTLPVAVFNILKGAQIWVFVGLQRPQMAHCKSTHISLGKVLEWRIHFKCFFKMRNWQEISNFLWTLKITFPLLAVARHQFFHIWANSTSEMETSLGYEDETSDSLNWKKIKRQKGHFQAFT